jgi:GDP-L-fucose synthase
MTIIAKVLVTGANGLLGSAICNELVKSDGIKVIQLTRADCDLLEESQVQSFFESVKPDWVFHCAAKVGGIGANKNYPVEFLAENITIQNNVIKAAHDVGVARLIFFASNAVYPENIHHPIKETDILTGSPEETVRPYALAKLAGIELCNSYNKQYGDRFLSLIPINLYGPRDNFDTKSSHVLPALIRKFHVAKESGAGVVEVWGSGNQRREFMCSLDLARIACEVMKFDDDKFSELCNTYPPLLNVGAGDDISIKGLAELIATHVGFNGKIVFDSTKPEGINKKQTSIDKMLNLGLQSEISLNDGIGIIYEYFVNEVHDR